jgi:hypothetical protein
VNKLSALPEIKSKVFWDAIDNISHTSDLAPIRSVLAHTALHPKGLSFDELAKVEMARNKVAKAILHYNQNWHQPTQPLQHWA